MKAVIRILSTLLLSTIYCFAIIVGSNAYVFTDYKSTSSENIESSFTAKIFHHTPQAESSINTLTSFSLPDSKVQLSGFETIIRITGQLIRTEFVQLKSFLYTVLINHRKSDIIFPFHYFW